MNRSPTHSWAWNTEPVPEPKPDSHPLYWLHNSGTWELRYPGVSRKYARVWRVSMGGAIMVELWDDIKTHNFYSMDDAKIWAMERIKVDVDE